MNFSDRQPPIKRRAPRGRSTGQRVLIERGVSMIRPEFT